MPTFSLTTFGSYGRNCQPADSPGGHLSRNGRSPMSLEIVHEDMSFGGKVVKITLLGLGWENVFFLFCEMCLVWFGYEVGCDFQCCFKLDVFLKVLGKDSNNHDKEEAARKCLKNWGKEVAHRIHGTGIFTYMGNTFRESTCQLPSPYQ